MVKYTADDANGFQAEVITNGVKTLHGHGAEAPSDAGGAVDNQVRHDSSEAEETDEDEAAAPHKGNAQYKVHEDYDEGGAQAEKDEGGEEDGEEEEEGGDDHQEYEGSSEEGYVEADAHSQQEESSSEDY